MALTDGGIGLTKMIHKVAIIILLILVPIKVFGQNDTIRAILANYSDIEFYVQKTTIYPNEAIDKEISGTVVYKIRVNKLGCIDSIVIIKNPNEILSQEVKRILRTTECNWTPAYYHNEPIDSWIYAKAPYFIMY